MRVWRLGFVMLTIALCGVIVHGQDKNLHLFAANDNHTGRLSVHANEAHLVPFDGVHHVLILRAIAPHGVWTSTHAPDNPINWETSSMIGFLNALLQNIPLHATLQTPQGQYPVILRGMMPDLLTMSMIYTIQFRNDRHASDLAATSPDLSNVTLLIELDEMTVWSIQTALDNPTHHLQTGAN